LSLEETVRRVKRVFKILSGFTLLLVGVIMFFTPGPGWLVILMGLALLAAEYVWARRLLNRLKAEGLRLRHAVFPHSSQKPSPSASSPVTVPESTPVAVGTAAAESDDR
jgi:Putative transmembrane protein (PGPGW)